MLFQNPILIKPIRLRETSEKTLQKNLKGTQGYKYTFRKPSIVTIARRKWITNYANDNFYEILKFGPEELPGHDRCIINLAYHFKTNLHACQPG